MSSAGGERDAGDLSVRTNRPIRLYLHVVAVAIIGAVAVFAWLLVIQVVNRLLWDNSFVSANRWMFPVICLPFALLVGLLVKYRHAPTTLDESFLDSLTGDVAEIDARKLPVNVVVAWASIFSGAVLGPEGGIAGISSRVAVLYGERLGIPLEQRSGLVFSALASALNGLVASVIFTGVLGSEVVKDRERRIRTLPANLIGGSIGFLIFFAAGGTGLRDYLHLAPVTAYVPADVLLVVLFGLTGLVLALITGGMFRAAARLFGRFEGREVERALVAGAIFSLVGMVAPILLFAGQSQIQTVVLDPSGYGAVELLVMALVKLALLAVASKSGFLGGPIFPSIFATTCVALALNLLFPEIPLALVIGGITAGYLMALFRAPFSATLLTAVMLQADVALAALIGLAVAAVMIVQRYLGAAITRARAAAGAAQPG